MGVWVTSLEWLGLVGFLGLSTFPILFFFVCAFSHHWKMWFKGSKFPIPLWLCPPLPFAMIHSLMCLAVGIGTWLVWREDHRAEGIFGPGPASGSIPDPRVLIDVSLVLFILWALLKIVTSATFWAGRAFSCCLAFELVQLAILMALTIISFFIWFVPGIVLALTVLWEAYLTSCCIYIVRCFSQKPRLRFHGDFMGSVHSRMQHLSDQMARVYQPDIATPPVALHGNVYPGEMPPQVYSNQGPIFYAGAEQDDEDFSNNSAPVWG